jgi:hypothetical protein
MNRCNSFINLVREEAGLRKLNCEKPVLLNKPSEEPSTESSGKASTR